MSIQPAAVACLPSPFLRLDVRQTRFIPLGVSRTTFLYFVRRPPFPLSHKSLLSRWGFFSEQIFPDGLTS